MDLAVVGVPFDTGVTYRVGGRFGPNAVRAASVMLRHYDPNLDVKHVLDDDPNQTGLPQLLGTEA